jgi:acyl-CoA oxidase
MPSPPPDWVKALKPSGPQGSELLAQERAQSNINVDKLSELLHTKEALDRQRKLLSLLEPEKVFDKSQNHSLGRVERLQRSLAKAKRLQQLAEQNQWSMEELHAANELIGEPTPYGLHASMFLVRILARDDSESSGANRSFLLGDPPGTRLPRTAQGLP